MYVKTLPKRSKLVVTWTPLPKASFKVDVDYGSPARERWRVVRQQTLFCGVTWMTDYVAVNGYVMAHHVEECVQQVSRHCVCTYNPHRGLVYAAMLEQVLCGAQCNVSFADGHLRYATSVTSEL